MLTGIWVGTDHCGVVVEYVGGLSGSGDVRMFCDVGDVAGKFMPFPAEIDKPYVVTKGTTETEKLLGSEKEDTPMPSQGEKQQKHM